MTKEKDNNDLLKVACVRIARRGLQEVANDNFEIGQSLIKTAEALAQGHGLDDVLKAHWSPNMHAKVAQALDEIVSIPSAVAQEYETQKRAEAKKLLMAKNASIKAASKKK